MAEENKDRNYWLFQGNSSKYDITAALKNGDLKSWKVTAHKTKITKGDCIIIWQTGENAGCYALAEVTSDVGNFPDEECELPYYKSEEDKKEISTSESVKISILHNFAESPVLWSVIKTKPEFAALNVGNRGTNFKATKEEYETILKMAESKDFSWVKTHQEIVKYLEKNEHNQLQLIDLLKSAGIGPFDNDVDVNGNKTDLKEIDPFTFFFFIYKYGQTRRLEFLQKIAAELNLEKPLGDFGIPSANAQKLWLFPYEGNRKNNEIKRLWDFFFAATESRITDELFADVIKIAGVGLAKITEGLYDVDPENYFPINGPTKPYLQEVLDINPNFKTFTEYKNILEQIRLKSDKAFYELSYDAWLWNSNKKIKEISNFPAKPFSTMKEATLNQIFYGPPGTGKTYNTISEALKIAAPKFYEVNKSNRKKLTDEFKKLLITDWEDTNGQIAFCTFHQSFTYEDFVEGIKPVTTIDKKINYNIEAGIFKKICDLAQASKSTKKIKTEGKIDWTDQDFQQASFFKMSLGESTNKEDTVIYDFCKTNDYIAIGFTQTDLTGKDESEIKEICTDEKLQPTAGSQMSNFIHGMKKGDYVLIGNGNSFVRALGKIVGDYEFHEDYPTSYKHYRKVEWIFVDESIPIEEIYDKQLRQQTIYRIDHEKVKKVFFVKDGATKNAEDDSIKPYILVIDEINRGNVSAIFGELITLIETDKREGKDEELQVVLPYSKKTFSVPDNVYIIGTMNTADRSIEALDSALRRRFNFTEIKPKSYLIKEILQDRSTWNFIDLQEILETINKRITVLIDREHQIGHSYFLKLKDASSANFGGILKAVFFENIIPLMQEYFFNDYVKIGMVLGTGFFEESVSEEQVFAEIEDSLEDDYSDVKTYNFKDVKDISDEDLVLILKTLLNK